MDLETTGISPFSDRIIEVGIVSFNLRNKETSKYECLVDPQIPISNEAFNIHGISNEDLAGKPLFKDIIKNIDLFIDNSILVIQNPRFDLSFLEIEYKRASKTFKKVIAFDTVTLSRKTFPDVPNYKLQTVAEHFGYEYEFHRAFNDADACKEIFKKVIMKADPNKKFTLSDLKSYQGSIHKADMIKEIASYEIMGNSIKIGDKILIEYKDSSGNCTKRKIRIKSLYKSGKSYIINGYCYLRDDNRCFNVNRIVNIEKK